MDLAVVVPVYNEATQVRGLLAALAAQTDREFMLVMVDNASTDDTAAIVRQFDAPFPVHLIHETERGAGTAADTGFRSSIDRGAQRLMRTDADCRPAPNWVATGRRLLTGKVEMLCGKSEMRRDERPNLIERSVLPTLTWIALHVANLRLRVSRLHNADAKPDRYFFVHGHNIAMTADLYLRCGGFPRERMIDGVDDTQLMNRVRLHSNNIVRTEEMVVEHSLRRERAWGLRRTILWQLNRRWSPATDDELHVR